MYLRKELKYSLYVMIHPFKGFYDLKHEKLGSLKAAVTIFLFYIVTSLLNRQLTGYIFNENDPTQLNILSEVSIVVLPYLIWCVANWCVTSLMDGEGNMRDIVLSTAYSLAPAILLNLVAIVLSRFLTFDEGGLYYLLISLSTFWSFSLIFLGMMVTHQYSLGKGVLTTALTIVGMAVIAFIGLLIFYLAQQVTVFISDVVKEITFRLNE